MSKVIIISDIHNCTSIVDKILTLVEHDQVIFTGDYFDSHWGDQVPLAESTARWVKEKLSDPKNIMLIGNHDMGYLFPKNLHATCSGFTTEKSDIINGILGEDFFKLKGFHFQNGILFSHAGVTRELVPYIMEQKTNWSVDEFISALDLKMKHSIQEMKIGRSTPLFAVGWDRGGNSNYGGITWQDQSMHMPIDGIPQIFGHSIREVPEFIFANSKGSKTSNGISPKTHSFRATIELTPATLKSHLQGKAWSLDGDTALNHFMVMDTEDNFISVYKLKKAKTVDEMTAEEVYTFDIVAKKHEK